MRGILLIVIVALGGSFANALAAPKIQQPACPALKSWAAQVNAETFNVAPRLQLPKAFDDTHMIPLFGASVLTWTPEDLSSANQALTQCYAEAGKRRDAAAAGALANANRSLQGILPRVNAVLLKAKTDADALAQQIAALPDSPNLDRGLAALLRTNPAQPDVTPYRGLPREIGDPLWRLASQVFPVMSDADRAALLKTVADRHASIQSGITNAAEKSVAGASADASGMIDLMTARAQVAAIDDDAIKTQIEQSADGRLKQIGDALRQAKPAVWVPPSCLDLYRWSGGDQANAGVAIGGRLVMTAFLDARAVPVFGISFADWTDPEIALFKTLRGLCQSAWQTAAASPGGNATELVRLAGRGRWIDTADAQIADARTVVGLYHHARDQLAASVEKARALPDSAASMPALLQLAQDPAQAQVPPDDRAKFIAALDAKRQSIAAQATQAAIKGLADVKVESVGDLKNLFAYASQVLPGIPDPRGQQAVRDAITRAMADDTARLLPALKTQLQSAPATLANVAEANIALLRLNGVSLQVANTPVYQTYVNAMEAAQDAMTKSARGAACDAFVSSLGASGEAAQIVWDGRDGMPLSEFLCEIDEHGTVEGYSGPGMFSSTTTLKALPFKSQLLTISMHKVDVKPGKTMLVGYKIEDAAQAGGQGGRGAPSPWQTTPNGEVPVEGWEIFISTVIGLNGSEGPECLKMIDNPAPDSLSPAAKVFWLHCWTFSEVRTHAAQRLRGP